MKKEDATTMENSIYGSRNVSSSEMLTYSDLLGSGGGGGYVNQCSMYDNYMMNNGINESELGFLEMLGVQEFQLPLGYKFEEMLEREMLLPSTTTDQFHHHHHNQVAAVLGDVNSIAPGTPNSSSISSASNNEGVAVESEHVKTEEDDDEEEEEEEDQEGSVKSRKL